MGWCSVLLKDYLFNIKVAFYIRDIKALQHLLVPLSVYCAASPIFFKEVGAYKFVFCDGAPQYQLLSASGSFYSGVWVLRPPYTHILPVNMAWQKKIGLICEMTIPKVEFVTSSPSVQKHQEQNPSVSSCCWASVPEWSGFCKGNSLDPPSKSA